MSYVSCIVSRVRVRGYPNPNPHLVFVLVTVYNIILD